MKRKLLIICGPTATGKTNLAINIAGKFNGELVSADSRQVYEGMDIGTGKGLQKNLRMKKLKNFDYNFYEINNARIWGYDLTKPAEDFSVSKYFDIAADIISGIWKRNKLPIIVGGTGLYIKALIDGIETISIPPDFKLRKKLEKKNIDELFEMLAGMDKKKADKMNDSDRKNPRRLIRAIEIAQQVSGIRYQVSSNNKVGYDLVIMIGLTAPKAVLDKRIEKRVEDRIRQGFEKEINKLIENKIDWKYKSMQGMGYRQYKDFYTNKKSLKEFIDNWFLAEQKYAKRQLTWFKKDKRINWFDISDSGFERIVEKRIQSWYYELEDKK